MGIFFDGKNLHLFRMITKKVTVRMKAGLHARPSSMLVKTASGFVSDFMIELQGYRINGKSILGIMMLAAECGTELQLMMDGPDEHEAMDAVIGLFAANFSEEGEAQERGEECGEERGDEKGDDHGDEKGDDHG
jgi:phosphocarrier protein HPr